MIVNCYFFDYEKELLLELIERRRLGVKMSEKKKILLLTLGTGPLSDNGEAGYRSVQYTIEGVEYKRKKDDINGTKTNFVAEPIIDYFEPDEIFILGTAKSVWHQFYASAITEDNEDKSYMDNKDYLRLMEIQKNNNVYTSGSELEKLSREISDIFARINTWEKFSKKIIGQKSSSAR